jgi:hypothetical protein
MKNIKQHTKKKNQSMKDVNSNSISSKMMLQRRNDEGRHIQINKNRIFHEQIQQTKLDKTKHCEENPSCLNEKTVDNNSNLHK